MQGQCSMGSDRKFEARAMWLPTPFYDRAPHYWLFIGALLAIVGVYLGFEGNHGFMYFGLITGLTTSAAGSIL